MKYCSNCGATNTDSAKFCTECGTALTAPEADYTNFSYNEVDDSNVSNEENTFDTTYTYGESTNSENTEVMTYTTSDDSEKTEDKYTYTYNADNKSGSNTYAGSFSSGIVPRNIVLSVVLSFVTCGIYQIYWFIKMNDEVNALANEPDAPSGIMVFLFTLITCGIYGFFWMYKMGERCDKIKGSVGGSSGILYLILGILGLSIVSYILIQDSINKAV